MASEQEKILRQNEDEINDLQDQLKIFSKMNEEVAQLKVKNEEKEVAIKNSEQSNSVDHLN